MSLQESRRTGRQRLHHLQEDHEFVKQQMAEERERFLRLASDESKPQVFSSFNLFPTPPELAARVIELADIKPGMSVLEPSAGMGALAKPARDAGGAVECVEIDMQMSNYLIDQGFAVDCCDFLTMELPTVGILKDGHGTRQIDERFDRVVMNPPFRLGADVKHVRRALQCVKPGGRLVSICAAGPKRQAAFADAQWIDLPAGSFKSEGTNVAAAIVIFNR